MNKIWVGCFLSSLFTPLANAQAPLTLEERLAQMEQRLQETEQLLYELTHEPPTAPAAYNIESLQLD